MSHTDRIKGVLVGQAAGDALGAPYEFGPPVPVKDIEMKGKPLGITPETGWRWEPGEWTDDTEQAIIVAWSRGDARQVAEGILAWYQGCPKDVGISTSAVLSMAKTADDVLVRSMQYGNLKYAGPRRPGMDPGLANGSLMRTGPVALPFLGDQAAVARVAREVSDVTHYDPSGFTGDACVLWSLLINEAIEQGEQFSLTSAFPVALTHIPTARHGFWFATVVDALGNDRTGQPNGGVVGAFKAALRAAADGRTFEGTVRLAVSYGRDTDTVAAIAGSLAGAIYGATAIPVEWIKLLHGWSPEGTMDAADLAGLAAESAGVQA